METSRHDFRVSFENLSKVKFSNEGRLCFALFMSLMDSSIASTAILVITDQLGGYDKSSWVFTSYLLTYSGK